MTPLRIALVGCGKAKLTHAAPARELYTGALFRAHLAEAEATSQHVYVVSALHGLLALDAEVEPYDVTLAGFDRDARAAWGRGVLESLARIYPAGSVELYVYAGAAYVAPLRAALAASPLEGWTLVEPLKGATQGVRLRMLSEVRRAREAARDATPAHVLRVAALRVAQSPGRHLYLFSVDGKRVPEFATVSRVRREDGLLTGYQRPEAMGHIAAIREYMESASPLVPNAVVLAFDSRVRFKELAPGAEHGHLEIPLEAGENAPGFIVDGQQRLAAVRDAEVASFPLACSAFITDSRGEQAEQFILVNRTKPLPAGLIHELLPTTRGALPAALEAKRLPAVLVERLNQDESSPLRGLVVTVTNPLRTGRTPAAWKGRTALLKDTSLLKALEYSLSDGALYSREPQDVDAMVRLVGAWWAAVRSTWPEAWGKHPSESRLFHGAGVTALGLLMDAAVDKLRRAGEALTEELFRRELALVAADCAWTKGAWDFPAPVGRREWKGIQNTPNDVRLLTQHLTTLYRERCRSREDRRPARKAGAA
ncbi:DGQHR domain-containing protein DpdB [Myxococcus sp. Y35]|uniref:DGQHR domain-containing protein DpdB n=1 Tax=Pseudomyxococcus flavus TaxID=3115648 RepID=UPI003CF8FA9E